MQNEYFSFSYGMFERKRKDFDYQTYKLKNEFLECYGLHKYQVNIFFNPHNKHASARVEVWDKKNRIYKTINSGQFEDRLDAWDWFTSIADELEVKERLKLTIS